MNMEQSPSQYAGREFPDASQIKSVADKIRPQTRAEQSATVEQREAQHFPERLMRAPEVMIFLRHDEKEAHAPGGGNDDVGIELTERGVRHTMDKRRRQWGPLLKKRDVRTRYSGRVRAGQTATGVAAHRNEEGYLESPLREGYIGSDERLNFILGSTPADEVMMEAYKDGRLLEWIVRESDAVGAQDGNEAFELTYKKLSGKIAQMILEELRADHDNEAVVLGSHQSVIDAFLARIVEEVYGIEARDKLIAALGDGKQGFGFSEGYAVGLYPGRNEVIIFYQSDKVDQNGKPAFTFNEIISQGVLEKIAQDAPGAAGITESATD